MSTYTPIASQTLGSAASSVTFTNIPQNFTDLILVTNADVTSAGASIYIRFNSNSVNYSYTTMIGNGSTTASARGANQTLSYIAAFVAPNTALEHTTITHIQNYSNATTNKTFLSRSNRASANTSPGAEAIVGLWRNTDAISTIFLAPDSGSFDAGSTFNLYGIASASASTGKASGGNIVTTDGTYWYHTFTSSGVFTPSTALTADYLVVAGGGGGGYWSGGGGGAGGLRCTVGATGGGGTLETSLSLTAQAYTVTIGAGGTAGTPSGANAGSGNNSVFSTITATGGGGGGNNNGGAPGATGAIGGSGGGGAGSGSGSSSGGAGTANQGFAGAGGQTGSPYRGGGGGGASAAGVAGATSGNGGNGVATSISGTSVTYAGGGGGGMEGSGTSGAGGTGGGGQGGSATSGAAVAGTVNTGGGGGAGRETVNGTAGGSGIVIIRYAV